MKPLQRLGVALACSAGFLALVLLLVVLDRSQLLQPALTKEAKPRQRPQAVVKDNHPPDPPLKPPAKSEPTQEARIANATELKEVQHEIVVTKERLEVLRKRANARPATVGAADRFTANGQRAIAEVQTIKAENDETERLRKRLSALMAMEAELETSE